MIFNDTKVLENIEFLEKERKNLWERLTALEKEVNTRPSDYGDEAKAASKKASEYRNRAHDTRIEADNILKEILIVKNEIENDKNSIASKLAEANDALKDLKNRNYLGCRKAI